MWCYYLVILFCPKCNLVLFCANRYIFSIHHVETACKKALKKSPSQFAAINVVLLASAEKKVGDLAMASKKLV